MMLNVEKIEKLLREENVASPKITYYPLTDSTNERAKVYALENPDDTDPKVFIADEQSAGRGRRGRSFVSNRGAGIYVSILTHPCTSGIDATRVTARAAVALARAIENVVRVDSQIKWVNDIYLGGKKLAGILVEGVMGNNGETPYIITGMGINVYKNAISEEISDIATSVENETGTQIEREKLTAEIIREFLCVTENMSEEELFSEYSKRSFIIGKDVTVMKLSESYEAKVLSLLPDYSLKIEKRNGETENLFTGEVSLKVNKYSD